MGKKEMKKGQKIWKALFFCLLCLFILNIYKTGTAVRAAETPEDGVYSINGVLRHASADQNSMGNDAIKKPMQLIVEDGEATLQMEFVPLSTKLGTMDFSGYLAEFMYFPDWEGGSSGYEQPDGELPENVEVISYYEGVYDSYNDPETGSDDTVKGLPYPHVVRMPVTLYDEEIWSEVYVPVMESIAAGNGRQYARLQLDWNSLTRTGDLEEEKPDDNGGGTDEKESVDKSSLHTLLLSAASMAGREDVYTKESLKVLKSAIDKAETVYANAKATQSQVDAQVRALSRAIINLEQKEEEKSGSSGSKSSSGEDLNIKKLDDGVYSIEGEMYKTDKKTLSMSNDAISHTIKLEVKKGKYTLTLDFKGLQINSQFGYLSQLKYYKSGYKTDRYGAPSGAVKNVTVQSYQKDSSGKKVRDSFGTNYPDKVTFTMIDEAKKDGWVPLQVFVPIMESISKGSGTQKVLLKLDVDSLASAENKSFKDDDSDTSAGKSSGSSSSSSGSSSKGKAVGASQLKSGSALPDKGTASKGAETENHTSSLQNSLLTETGQTTQDGESEDLSAEETTEGTQEKTETSKGSFMPSFMSILAVLAGGFYKLWSRRLF